MPHEAPPSPNHGALAFSNVVEREANPARRLRSSLLSKHIEMVTYYPGLYMGPGVMRTASAIP